MLENQKVILYKMVSTDRFPIDFQIRFHTHIYCQSGTIQFVFNNFVVKRENLSFGSQVLMFRIYLSQRILKLRSSW